MTTPSPAERLSRPQRIGLFGHRGVGKTTLLTMWYREAVGGRLPDLRLAAGNAATANYLAAKILHLEDGTPLPATLAETELRLQLYHGPTRLELVVKDYQGEHVRLGSTEPIRDFLRDCDAVLLCLDPAILSDPRERLEAQQEIEQVIEDYLALERGNASPRPMALVLTKGDRLPPGVDQEAHLRQLVETHLGMTQHALTQHAPQHALFAVSALGGDPGKPLEPRGLAEPLRWLAGALRAQDEHRLEQLWEARCPLPALGRALDAVAKRYPDADFVPRQRRRWQEKQAQRIVRRTLVGFVAAAACALGLFGYEAVGAYRVRQSDQGDGDPAAKLQAWHDYQTWHPARHLLGFGSPTEEEARVAELEHDHARQQAAARLAELKLRAANPETDFEEVWEQYVACQREYKDLAFDEEMAQLRDLLKQRRDAKVERRAELALIDLRQAQEASLEEADLLARRKRLVGLVARADDFVKSFADVPQTQEARQRRDWGRERIDDLDFELARRYSSENPLNFQTRREQYLAYLDVHAEGRHAAEARGDLALVDRDWDRHDWKPVVDQWRREYSNIKEMTARCQHYVRIHPKGRHRDKAEELLRWCTMVGEEREYHVVLKRGSFDKSVTRALRSAPDLSIEVEVGGIRYGPSHVVKDSLTPEWDYEFPRPIKWKLGDPVRIMVSNHDYYKKLVIETGSGDDPVGMNYLSRTIDYEQHTITFESDYWVPAAPEMD